MLVCFFLAIRNCLSVCQSLSLSQVSGMLSACVVFEPQASVTSNNSNWVFGEVCFSQASTLCLCLCLPGGSQGQDTADGRAHRPTGQRGAGECLSQPCACALSVLLSLLVSLSLRLSLSLGLCLHRQKLPPANDWKMRRRWGLVIHPIVNCYSFFCTF